MNSIELCVNIYRKIKIKLKDKVVGVENQKR